MTFERASTIVKLKLSKILGRCKMVQIDIGMPQSCLECPLRERGVHLDIDTHGVHPTNFCMPEFGKKIDTDLDGKPDWCPLKEVET